MPGMPSPLSRKREPLAPPHLGCGGRGRPPQAAPRRPPLRRCRETAHWWLLPPLGATPHQFRHTFAHQWLAKGGAEVDLMRPGRVAVAGDGGPLRR
jgi:integrase